MLHLQAVVGQLALLGALEHVVGPLGAAAAALTVHEAAAARREGAPPPASVVHPGFLSVAVVVLKDKQEDVRRDDSGGFPAADEGQNQLRRFGEDFYIHWV